MFRRALLLTLVAVTAASAQPSSRRATNLASILAYPGFYFGRALLLVGTVAEKNGEFRVSDDEESVPLIFKGNPPDGLDELRGEFWDLGRMKPDDIRLGTYDLRTVFHLDPDAGWPRPGEVTAFVATSVTSATLPQAPSIRSIVLHPFRYVDQKVTITGQFSGRNLLGDLPAAPGKSRYDFVLRSADAAIWVINMRPRLKDASGKDIELGLDARIDTGRWLEVRGTVQHARGLQWLDAEAGSLKFSKPATETMTEETPVRVPAGPPPEVIFSAPTEDETDVSLNTAVRIQFSRDLDQKTLKDHIHPHYVQTQSVERGEPDTPGVEFSYNYVAATRVVELKFTKPLERFRTLKIDLEGILGTDGQPLKPWTLTFALGGS
jgi:hypothetical protein